jgi:hypothetical protein
VAGDSQRQFPVCERPGRYTAGAGCLGAQGLRPGGWQTPKMAPRLGRELTVVSQGTRVEDSVTSLSWIPREAIEGLSKIPFEVNVTRYDEPPPDRLAEGDLETLRCGAVSVCQPAPGMGRDRGRQDCALRAGGSEPDRQDAGEVRPLPGRGSPCPVPSPAC